MTRHLRIALALLALTAGMAAGQANTNLPLPEARVVMVDSNGVVTIPANFLVANGLNTTGSVVELTLRLETIEGRTNAWNAAVLYDIDDVTGNGAWTTNSMLVGASASEGYRLTADGFGWTHDELGHIARMQHNLSAGTWEMVYRPSGWSAPATNTVATIDAGGWRYLHGDADSDGSWRIGYDAAQSNCVVQVRQAGAWTNSTRFIAP